jgi:hypothetical protein
LCCPKQSGVLSTVRCLRPASTYTSKFRRRHALVLRCYRFLSKPYPASKVEATRASELHQALSTPWQRLTMGASLLIVVDSETVQPFGNDMLHTRPTCEPVAQFRLQEPNLDHSPFVPFLKKSGGASKPTTKRQDSSVFDGAATRDNTARGIACNHFSK